MKTKLLRQIRNRYVIKQAYRLASNTNKNLTKYADVFTGYPLYIVIDKKDHTYEAVVSTYKEAHNILCEWISIDYIHLKKHKPKDKTPTVVWGNNK